MEVSWQDLICLPDGEAVAALRKSWNWLLPEPWEPLLFSALGDVFLKQSSEEIFWLNCGTAELSRVAGNSGEFEAILGTAVADNWFMPDLIKELRFEGKIPSTGQCCGVGVCCALAMWSQLELRHPRQTDKRH